MALCMDSPTYRVKATSVANFEEFWQSLAQNPYRMTSFDFASQIRAMLQHDITKHTNGSLPEAAARIKATVFFIISIQDHLVNPQPILALTQLLQAKTLILDSELGHLAVGNELKIVLPAMAEFWAKP